MHVHVHGSDVEAKFWLEQAIALARSYGFSPRQLAGIEEIIKAHEYELIDARDAHFGR